MATLDPYPKGMSLKEIYTKKFTFLRCVILFIGVISLTNGVLQLFGVNVFFPCTAQLAYLLANCSAEALSNGEMVKFILALIVYLLCGLAYVVLGLMSKVKKSLVYYATAFFVVDCLAMFIDLDSVTMTCIICHVLGLIVFVKGAIETKKYIKIEREYLISKTNKTGEKPFDAYPFMFSGK